MLSNFHNLAAQSKRLKHLDLKCPGPRKTVGRLVLGTQVCPNSTTITLETGVLYKYSEGKRRSQHQTVGLRMRCKSCEGRFQFNEFLTRNFLEADADQETCNYKNCFKSAWQGSKLCHDHFLKWTPDLLIYDETAITELRRLFEVAASEQWLPEAVTMKKVIKKINKMESDDKANIPASNIVNIDLETSFHSREVLQIGLTDLDGRAVLDCLTKYSEIAIALSSSQRAGPPSWTKNMHEKKVRAFVTKNGTLDASEVIQKLNEAGISKQTIFLSWASWCIDLSYLRGWLEQEGFHDVLPGDSNVCLLLKEFRANVKRVIGATCYQNRPFPLSLPVVFLALFGDDHPLSLRNHHALVDAQQLALMAKLFVDLCKPPNERVFSKEAGIWKESGMKMPGKRQRPIKEFFTPISSGKKARLS